MKSGTVPISVIILTHRSDGRFIAALASAQPASEVLVVDFGSGNNWQQLKKRFSFNLVARKGPILNFSAERNEALKKARHEWALFLDSDEVITQHSWPEIAKIAESSRADGICVQRQDVFYGRTLQFGETGNVWLVRLMKKTASQFTRPVHEIAQVIGQTEGSNIVLQHHAHTTVAEFLQDITAYAKIEAEYQKDYRLGNFRLGVKTIVYPKGKFLINYFFKLGFLDGWRGLIYAVMMSLHSVFVRVFSYENR